MIKKIFDLFKKENCEIYLVGGYVRDQFLGKETHDLDFAVNVPPERTKKILEDSGYSPHLVGWAFGTVGIISEGYNIQITTYRKNESYNPESRNPKLEWGKTIQEDLVRRDFKINAFAQDDAGVIIDLFGGINDLKIKLLDTPIAADIAFNDDPLRILRAVRFRAKLGFEYSEQIKQGIKNQAHRVLILSRERIVDEINKILVTDRVAEALEEMMEYRLLHYILPELTILDKINQESVYHSKNVWKHTVSVVKNTPNDLILRWAALFHDIGKMSTHSIVNGNVHFYEHETVGANITYSILCRLGLPKQWIKDITYLVRNHMRANTYLESWTDSAVRRFIRDTGNYCEKLILLSKADITSHNPTTIKKHLDSLINLEKRIIEQREFKEIKCPVSGNAVMNYFKLGQERKVGEIKDLILNAVLNGELGLGLDEKTYLKYAEEKLQRVG